MSAMTMSPARVSAGGSTSGSFGAASVTVSPGFDRVADRLRRVGRQPGRQIDRDDRDARGVDVGDDASRCRPVSGALSPVPKIASTISVQSLTSEKCSSHAWLSAISTTVRPRRPRMSRLMRASPRTSATLADAGTPRRRRRAAAACARRRSRRRRCCRGRRARRPAGRAGRRRSLRSRPPPGGRRSPSAPATGCRSSSIVRRSASRICAALSTRIVSAGTTPDAVAPWLGPTVVRLDRMAATVNVNGRVFDQEHAVISVFDHGFLYGEGVYETLRTYNGQPFLFDRHMRACATRPACSRCRCRSTDEEMARRCRETMDAAGLGDGPDERGVHPHPGHARRRRAVLRSRPPARAVGRRHRQAAGRSAAPRPTSRA